MAKKIHPDANHVEPPSPLEQASQAAPELNPEPAKPPEKKPAKKPTTQQEIFDAETRIVRFLLKQINKRLPDEKSRQRVLNRIYELREFPLIDNTGRDHDI